MYPFKFDEMMQKAVQTNKKQVCLVDLDLKQNIDRLCVQRAKQSCESQSFQRPWLENSL